MKSIRGKILSLNLLIIVLCTLVLGGTSIFFLTQNQEEEAEQILSLTTDQLAEQINTELYSIQTAVDSLCAAAQDTCPTLAEMKEGKALEKYVADMDYISRNIAENTDGVCAYYMRIAPELTPKPVGFLYSKTSTDDKLTEVGLTDLSKYDPEDVEHVGWYYEPKNAGRAVWMEPYYNKNLNIYMISYVVPIYKEGVFLGVIGMDVDFDEVNERIQQDKPYETSHAFIASDTGKLYYPPEEVTEENLADIAPELAELTESFRLDEHKNNKKHKICTFEVNGIRRVLAHSHTINSMNLMLDAETREIYAARDMLVIIILVAALLIALISILISMQASRRITDPLQKLTVAADLIASGEMNVELPEKTDDEVGILTESLAKTVDSLKIFITGIRNEAYTDGLTHVRNKRSFEIAMGGLAKRMEKGDRRFGLLMLDVNELKQMNDVNGHSAGDKYLINCCHLICETFRHSPVFRIGGDEFVVLLDGEDYEHYRYLISKMEVYMETSRQKEYPEDRLSIAKGASFCMPTDKSPEDIFKRADKMMYIDKRHMKNMGE